MIERLTDVARSMEPAVPADYLRLWVIAFAVLVVALHLHSLRDQRRAARRHRRREERRGDAPLISEMAWGRGARSVAIVLLVGDEIYGVTQRLGHEHLTLKTPALQVALIAALYAWAKLDRREYHDIDQAVDIVAHKIKRGQL